MSRANKANAAPHARNGDMTTLQYLTGYSPELRAQAQRLIDRGQLAAALQERYPRVHDVRTDKALYLYVTGLKNTHLRSVEAIDKIAFDSRIHVLKNALGTHTSISRVQGGRLKAKREIRIATLFKTAPAEFLEMIVAHELAHSRHADHDKAFYQLCRHLCPDYHQFEFDLRLYLTHLENAGDPLWCPSDHLSKPDRDDKIQ